MFFVYVIDDNPIIVKAYEKLLLRIKEVEQLSITVQGFTSGQEFLTFIEEHPEVAVDFVYMDISMQGLDGFETAKRLKKKRKQAKVVFLSANEANAFTSAKAGGIAYLSKNLDDEATFTAMFMKWYKQHQEQTELVLNVLDEHMVAQVVPFFEVLWIDQVTKQVHTEQAIYQLDQRDVASYETLLSHHFSRLKQANVIVNVEHIKKIEENQVILDNHENISITKEEAIALRFAFAKYLSASF